jgi:hypothetical protein
MELVNETRKGSYPSISVRSGEDRTACMITLNPYDKLLDKSLPIEWTAPERLALASLLHGGPRPPLDTYRVLELGCGDGANLNFRKHKPKCGVL